ncbi:MAG: LytR C-terminal domain-containing protein [Candidatus Woesebacteria bacterium]|nr:LytR C-terminal domain-containing protein [Candidatus Woesebacteria bacterium]
MEDQSTQSEVAQQGPPQASSFHSPTKSKSSSSKWVIIFIGLLILGVAGIFFFTKSSSEAIPSPTPSFGVVPIEENMEESTPLPTTSPEPINKEKVSIEVLNGTGISGEAKLLSDKLKALGYSNITAGNASSTDNTEATVTFSKTLSQSTQDEIKKELDSFYKTVNVKTSSTQKSDIVVVTGLRGNQTAKPTSSATPSASPSATPTTNP